MTALVDYAGDNPLPAACGALLLVLPGVLLAGAPIARLAVRDERSRAIVTPGLGLCLWLVLVALTGRIAHAFVPAFVGGTLATGLFGYAALAVRGLRGGLQRPRWLVRWPAIVIAVVTTLAIWPATALNFHDELTVAGHWVTIGQLQNGVFPPRFPIFPAYELRYHYAFDVLAAMLSGLFRTGVPRSIDAATLVLWVYTVLLLYRVGERFVDVRHAWLTPVVGLFGGGVPFFCHTAAGTLGSHLLGQCSIDGLWLAPSTASQFFQHPFALGFPLSLLLLILLAERDSPSLAARFVAMGIVLVALAQSQIVMFATVGASVLAAECLPGGKPDVRRIVAAVVTAVVAVAVARALGGFFAPAPYQAGPALELHLGITNTASGGMWWMAQTFGLLLVAGPIGIFLLRRERPVFGVVIVGCLATIYFVRYAHSWDIVKFANVAAFFLAIASSASIAWCFRQALKPAVVRGALRLVGAAGLVAVVAAGVAFHYVMISDIPGAYHESPVKLGGDDAKILSYLRRHAQPGEIVYRDERQALGYAEWGGMATAFPVYPTKSFGFTPEVIAARWRLLRGLPPDLRAYTAQGIRWFVISSSDRKLSASARTWLSQRSARLVLRSGSLMLVQAVDQR